MQASCTSTSYQVKKCPRPLPATVRNSPPLRPERYLRKAGLGTRSFEKWFLCRVGDFRSIFGRRQIRRNSGRTCWDQVCGVWAVRPKLRSPTQSCRRKRSRPSPDVPLSALASLVRILPPNPRRGALTIEICRDLTLVCAPCVAMLQLIGRVDKGNKGA